MVHVVSAVEYVDTDSSAHLTVHRALLSDSPAFPWDFGFVIYSVPILRVSDLTHIFVFPREPLSTFLCT